MGKIIVSESTCCGEIYWYVANAMTDRQGLPSAAELKKELNEVAKTSVNRGIAQVVLTNNQIAYRIKPEDVLIEFGFKKTWGPILNPNTKRNLFGYSLDLNEWREKNMAKATGLTKKAA